MARAVRATLAGLLAALACLMFTDAPAWAEETVALEVTGTQATPGKVTFYLAARGVPAGELTKQSVAVTAGGEELPVEVEQFAGSVPRTTPQPRGVILLIDISGSMAQGGLLASARTAAAAYAVGLPSDVELGLVTFADTASTVVPPTTDRAKFTTALDKLTASGATALYDGVKHALRLLGPATKYSERRVVVLSDGADTASKTSPVQLAKDLTAAKAMLDVVAVTAEANSAAVSKLATGTGGKLVPAADPDAARRAFRALASALSPPVLVTATVPTSLSGKEDSLTIKLTTAEGTGASTVPVRFGVDPKAAVSREYHQTPAPPKTMLVVGVVAVTVALLLASMVGLYLWLGGGELRKRLKQLDAFSADRLQENMVKAGHQQASPLLRKALEISEKAVNKNDKTAEIVAQLERAGMDLRPQEWYLIRAGASLVTALVLGLLLPFWVGFPLGLLGGWFGTGTYRKLRESRRTRKFADLLPDALQLVVSALRSGFSLAQALDAVVREGPEPINTEFGRAVAETRLGGELEDALERAAHRNNSRDLSWLVMAIKIQREVGGNLSEVLSTATDTMRERARLNRHVRALSAEGRLSAYILAGMPVLVSIYMFISNGEYLQPLLTEPMGWGMLGCGAASLGAGVFWMSRIIKVKV
jgi:Flp pilus assembly protein TadB/uncharacterized protein YegL